LSDDNKPAEKLGMFGKLKAAMKIKTKKIIVKDKKMKEFYRAFPSPNNMTVTPIKKYLKSNLGNYNGTVVIKRLHL
jgi:hypothetical protein